MSDAFLIGTASTAFRKHPDRDFRSLVGEVLEGALQDAGIDEVDIGSAWFGNCAMQHWGQDNIRGQTVLPRAPFPIFNVEGGCATGSIALHSAVNAVRAGAPVAVAIGVEKTFIPTDPKKMLQLFAHGIDQRHREEWEEFFASQDAEHDLGMAFHPARVMFLDVHAAQAKWHMARWGTTVEQIAAGASKNHGHAVSNDKAQYRFAVSVEDVLRDKPIIGPLTRAMCSPISDGAAAVIVASEDVVNGLDRTRGIRVRASAMAGGRWRDISEDSVTRRAGDLAFEQAGLERADVDVAEVHDATSFCELYHLEQLRFVEDGQGGPFVASGAATLGGTLPTNLSGGLVSKGHPLGATGLGMIDELVLQLRGEAGERQVEGARIALQHNAGGLIGWDEAVAAVHLLQRE